MLSLLSPFPLFFRTSHRVASKVYSSSGSLVLVVSPRCYLNHCISSPLPPLLRVVGFSASLWSSRSPRVSSPRGSSYRLPEHDGSAVLSFLASLFGPTRQVGRGYILSQMLVLLSFSLLASLGFGSLFSVARYLCVGLRWRGVCGAFWILLGLRLRSLGACREF